MIRLYNMSENTGKTGVLWTMQVKFTGLWHMGNKGEEPYAAFLF